MVKMYCADLESTGLLNQLRQQGSRARLHNFCARNVENDGTWTFNPNTVDGKENLSKFLDRNIVLIMHNGISYDRKALEFFGYDVSKVHFVDTLGLSWYLDLNRPKHGLESYGDEFGVPKPEIKDWSELTQEDYDHRVQEDVKIQHLTYKKLKSRFEELYGKLTDYEFCTHSVVKYINFKMEQLSIQETNKFRVDVDLATKLVKQFDKEIEFKVLELSKVMPKVPVHTFVKPPAKPYKKNGDLSATGLKWAAITDGMQLPFTHNEPIKVLQGYDEPNPNSPLQVKDWLFSLGWIPETFKFVKEDGVERKIPQVYIQGSGGQMCPSIVKLSEDRPELEHLVGRGVLVHRRGCVQGFLDSLVDGEHVEAGASGFTNTLRLKHRKPCVNLPSLRAAYGNEVRSCLIAKDGMKLCGSDLSGLENTLKFNFQMPFDPEFVLAQQSDDYDPHLEMAVDAGLLKQCESDFYKIVKEGFSQDRYEQSDDLVHLLSLPEDLKTALIKHIAKIRGIGKAANYAQQYGAGYATVARTCGVKESVAKKMVKVYKRKNWSIDKVAKQQKRKLTSFGTFQLNPLNKIWYHLKTEKDAFSTLVQGSGSYILDLWVLFAKKRFVYDLGLLASFHDEMVIEFKEDEVSEKDIVEVLDNAIGDVNNLLKTEIPFACDTQFGYKYSDIH